MSFEKLSKKELLRTLDEDFAFELTEEEKATKDTILAAVSEGKLKFGDYLNANPDQREKFEAPVVPTNVVAPAPAPTVVDGVAVATTVPESEAPWLIKMERKNPLYEIGRYKWTATHPYALVAVSDVSAVIKEGGFRQALPEELAEYYG